jgi:hypothetical protein
MALSNILSCGTFACPASFDFAGAEPALSEGEGLRMTGGEGPVRAEPSRSANAQCTCEARFGISMVFFCN